MNELEGFWAEVDRRYATELVAKVRKATVTAAASPTSYTVQFPGETSGRDGVPSVSPVVPQVGDIVRVELVGDEPCIVGVYGGPPAPLAADTAATVTTSSTSYVGLSGGPAVTLDLVAGQTVTVTVYARLSVTSGGLGHQAAMAWAVSGADTVAAADADAVECQSTLLVPGQKSGLYTAVTTGSHTVTAQYKTAAGADTATFVNRRLLVEL